MDDSTIYEGGISTSDALENVFVRSNVKLLLYEMQ